MPELSPISFALNQKTTPGLSFTAFLDLAAELGCVGVEARTDLGRPLFDGLAPAAAGRLARDRNLRLVGLSEVYPFDDWTEARRDAVAALLDAAAEAGAETVSLIPRVDGAGPAMSGAAASHEAILAEILALAEGSGVVPLVEPIGFPGSSIRHQRQAADAIELLAATGRLGLLHDTFQHSLAEDSAFLVDHIRLVHISGVGRVGHPLSQADDALRGLMDDTDRTGALDQIRHLVSLGYRGAFSFEATAPDPRYRDDPRPAIAASIDFVVQGSAPTGIPPEVPT